MRARPIMKLKAMHILREGWTELKQFKTFAIYGGEVSPAIELFFDQKKQVFLVQRHF